jgi:hypothetical protein
MERTAKGETVSAQGFDPSMAPARVGAEPDWLKPPPEGARPRETEGPLSARAPAVPVSGAPLHFYRCADCFGTLALERDDTGARCDCGGALEYLGRAENDRLIVDGFRVPCDSRCVNARGPKCECGCGGANHGNGALVQVQIDAGGVPVASKPHDREKRHEIAGTFRAALARAEANYSAKVGQVIGYDAAAWQIREQLKNARKFKTQKRRLAAIDAAEALLLKYRRP